MNWKNITLLDIVETQATEHGLIASEEELSERFDEEVAPDLIAKYGAYDSVAFNEAFGIWADMLCKDGEIHEEQYNSYEYVGIYSS